MSLKKEIDAAAEILEKMYTEFRAAITNEQWQDYLEEIKQARINFDGVVLDGVELEETAKANVLARLAAHAQGVNNG